MNDKNESRKRQSIMAAAFDMSGATALEYQIAEDRLLLYDEKMNVAEDVPGYLKNLSDRRHIFPEDRWKIEAFFRETLAGPLEVRIWKDGQEERIILNAAHMVQDGRECLVGALRDVTWERKRVRELENQANRDSMTMLYNHLHGKRLINEYLENRSPYSSCGMMMVDVDYFKDVNDTYGHLFGDTVLTELSQLFLSMFRPEDIVMRAGGDEFVILLKDISNKAMVKKAIKLVKAVREKRFGDRECTITCSVGVCFLPANENGYTYDQLFDNADWALYRAKEGGRNRCFFCDNLQRYKSAEAGNHREASEIEARFLSNDVVATAFEIFEKTNSYQKAIDLLLQVVGIRFQLDRITVIYTDMKENECMRQFQWRSEHCPPVLDTAGSFEKSDFLTLFHSYDEYGTTVLQCDDMDMYSPQAQALLMQGEAKTVVYAAMYCGGRYVGAISYVVCTGKRRWSKEHRRELGELTKIISAHMAKNQEMNAWNDSSCSLPDYDSLTGLLSFSRFREEVERMIVGGFAASHALISFDFADFKYFNQRYGYSRGDRLLRDFSEVVIGMVEQETETFFTRVVSDQFILFAPCPSAEKLLEKVHENNKEFVRQQRKIYPEARLRIRTGIYPVSGDCVGASEAIDAADFARKQVSSQNSYLPVIFDEALREKKQLENEIFNSFDAAIRNQEFQVYLQPKFSMTDFSMIGAEALVRWTRPDGTVLQPDQFVPACEKNGRIIELDYYVFERAVEFLAEHRQAAKKLVISVNVSALHAREEGTVQRYLDILRKYQVEPSATEVELTETAIVKDYDNVRNLFADFQKAGIGTSLDDFGAGYSVLNTIFDIPVDTLKIDRLFVANCVRTKRGTRFLGELIHLMKEIGYQILCEGVETKEQMETLRDIWSEQGQGFWYARPMTMEEFDRKYGGMLEHGAEGSV